MPNAVDSDFYDPIDGKPSMHNRDSLYFILGERPESLSPRYVSMDDLETLAERIKQNKDTHWSYVLIDDTIDASKLHHAIGRLKEAGAVTIRSIFDSPARFY